MELVGHASFDVRVLSLVSVHSYGRPWADWFIWSSQLAETSGGRLVPLCPRLPFCILLSLCLSMVTKATVTLWPFLSNGRNRSDHVIWGFACRYASARPALPSAPPHVTTSGGGLCPGRARRLRQVAPARAWRGSRPFWTRERTAPLG